MPVTIPVTVWEQISVVVIFAVLIGGMGYYGAKLFIAALKDLATQFSQTTENSNQKWREYFDARSESANQLSEQMTKRMDEIAKILDGLVKNFDAHDLMERQALDEMAQKRNLSKTKPVK